MSEEDEVERSLLSTVEMPSAFTIYYRIANLQAQQAARRSMRTLHINSPKNLAFESLKPPDTEAVKRAAQLCRDFSDDVLFNHCMRSYYFAMAIFQHYGLTKTLDVEAAFVAMAFHDFGLTEEGRSNAEDLKLEFEIRGARKCYKCAVKDLGYKPEKAKVLYEAIRLHTSMGRAEKGTDIGKFVNFGSVCDVIGYHIEDVHKKTKNSIIEEFPRLNWKKVVIQTFIDEFQMSPCPMTKFSRDRLFMNFYIRHSPFKQ